MSSSSVRAYIRSKQGLSLWLRCIDGATKSFYFVLGDEEAFECVDIVADDGNDAYHHEQGRESLLSVNHYELACEALRVGAFDVLSFRMTEPRKYPSFRSHIPFRSSRMCSHFGLTQT